jgi:hypothetical protein
MSTKQSVFKTLSTINLNDKVEKKKNLTYLSWAWAWGEVKKAYPNATYQIIEDSNGLPYIYDENLGYMVQTSVTIEGESLSMWLPVMDGANKSMKSKSYDYTTRYGDKTCEAATMFDINKTLMRCLTKNLAMHGLGHYIYAGEDIPEEPEHKKKSEEKSKVVLELKTDNWVRVTKWIVANKSLGMEKIIDTLGQKYNISPTIKKSIEKLV